MNDWLIHVTFSAPINNFCPNNLIRYHKKAVTCDIDFCGGLAAAKPETLSNLPDLFNVKISGQCRQSFSPPILFDNLLKKFINQVS